MNAPGATKVARSLAAKVDPRIAERRRQVSDEAGRRRRRRLAFGLGSVAVAVAVAATTFSPVLDVDRVTVMGTDALTAGDVMVVGRLRIGDAMVTVDADDVERRLAADVRVSRVSVTRRWPATIEVRLTAREPALALVGPQGSKLVSADGYVLDDRDPVTPPGIWELKVPALSSFGTGRRESERLTALIAVAAAVPDRVKYFVVSMSVEGDGELHMLLSTGADVTFGSPDRADHKFVALATMFGGQVEDPEEFCRIDVTDPFLVRAARPPFCDPTPEPPVQDPPTGDDRVDAPPESR